MKRTVYSIFSLVIVGVMNLFTFGTLHAAAMPQAARMSGMNHGVMSSKSVSCVTVCTTATFSRGDDLELLDSEQDDDETTAPFYASTSEAIAGISKLHSDTTRNLVKFEPPPGRPLYIQFATLRP